MDFRKQFILFFKGLLMGVADVVPGVSGGTIAFITGIYQRLIHALSTIDLRFIPLFFKGKFDRSLGVFKTIQFTFLIPLGFGILVAILLFSKLILSLLQSYPAYVFAFFTGLIIASAFIIYKQISGSLVRNLLFVILGALVSYTIAGLTAISTTHTLVFIFVSAFLAISAMVLPGISGSFVLLLLGQYEYILTALHDKNYLVIFVFVLGALAGLLSFTRFVDFLFKRFKNFTLSFLMGLMLGSLRIPYSEIASTPNDSFYVLLFVLIGLLIVFVVENLFKEKQITSGV